MQHPFDGIIESTEEEHLKISRRQAVKLAGCTAAALGLSRFTEAAEKIGPRKLYFVVPASMKRFDRARRQELDVWGDRVDGWQGHAQFRKARGYMAWLKPDQAKKLAFQKDITTVHEVTGKDISPPAGKTTNRLQIHLAPNSWRTRPNPASYSKAKSIAGEWKKSLGKKVAGVSASNDGSSVFILLRAKSAKDVLKVIRNHPQAWSVAWAPAEQHVTRRRGEGGFTTQRLNEEGVTTHALGEEGATTRALGEEGGRPPRPTTLAIGEEGGR